MIEDISLKEITNQVIAIKRLRKAPPEYKHFKEYLFKTGGVVCTTNEEIFKTEIDIK